MARRVAYFRSEGNRQQLQERLRICGVKPTILLDSDRFRSVPREKLSHFLAAHNGWADGGVVIIDTATNAGGATNDAAEGDTWLSWAVYTFTSRNDATLVVSIDHVTKRIPDDVLTINSRGTGAKGDASDFTLFCDSYKGKGKTLTSTCWNREQNGHVHLRIAKPDRHGHIAADDDTNLLATLHGYHDPALGLLRLTIDPPKADTDTDDTAAVDPKRVALTIVQDHDKINTRRPVCAARPETITEALMRSTVIGPSWTAASSTQPSRRQRRHTTTASASTAWHTLTHTNMAGMAVISVSHTHHTSVVVVVSPVRGTTPHATPIRHHHHHRQPRKATP